MGFPSGTRSRAARARPGALTMRERARATRSGGSPRMRPLGKGWSRPRATTEAELVTGAKRSSSIPSCAESSAALGFRVRKLSGPKSSLRPRKSPERTLPPKRMSDSSKTTSRSLMRARTDSAPRLSPAVSGPPARTRAAPSPLIPPPTTTTRLTSKDHPHTARQDLPRPRKSSAPRSTRRCGQRPLPPRRRRDGPRYRGRRGPRGGPR